MAEGTLEISLCSPTHAPVDLSATEIAVPGEAGVFSVLPGHTPLLTSLTKGVLIAYHPEEGDRFFAIHDGFAEILHNHITILADIMEVEEDIDIERAEAARERAQERLRKREPDLDTARAEATLARSLARIQAHGRHEI